ncbi:MAG: hypothetical protein OXC92_03480 [Flavobacteriaceae bacterium]|nr:hypothetical protein [Flavobacteriaceae bacterium]MCY4216032.1 hypothetical protein [Flavobacteriaceae bacterium]
MSFQQFHFIAEFEKTIEIQTCRKQFENNAFVFSLLQQQFMWLMERLVVFIFKQTVHEFSFRSQTRAYEKSME